MPPSKQGLLENFGQIVADLELLFRSKQTFTENEQLFFENRLLILRLQYFRWAKGPRPKQDLPLGSEASPTPLLLDQGLSETDA